MSTKFFAVFFTSVLFCLNSFAQASNYPEDIEACPKFIKIIGESESITFYLTNIPQGQSCPLSHKNSRLVYVGSGATLKLTSVDGTVNTVTLKEGQVIDAKENTIQVEVLKGNYISLGAAPLNK
jgi:hypothetical protein